MIQDLHSHTYYSFCGKDAPSAVVEAAIDGGIETFGITDHSYGIGNSRKDVDYGQHKTLDYQRSIGAYLDHISLLKEKYASKIDIKCGIEIATLNRPHLLLPEGIDISGFDFCLLESIDSPDSVCKDLFSFAKKLNCPKVGVAHTDLMGFLDGRGIDKLEYLREMADRGIFWEINVNYDSIHKYREHSYVKEFFESEEQQDIVRRSGVRLSVGFDGHRLEDYLPERVRSACERLSELHIPLIYD